MATEEACDVLPVPKFTPEYTSKGEFELVENRKVYITGNRKATWAVVAIYDVFGFSKQVFQGADFLATGSSNAPLVLIPDFFNGEPLGSEKVPRDDPEITAAWRVKNAPEKQLAYLQTVFDWVKNTFPTVRVAGLYGFCWGGKLAILAAKNNIVGAISLIHPSRLEALDADGIEDTPVLLIASNGEDEEKLNPLLQKLRKVTYIRFDDVHHGFAAARGDWSVPLQKQRAEEALQKTNEFFVKHLL
ncbi:Alpha/Beta hydrolase protein [Lipomyces japonicus]|uniref:Alpha/Beta hydrolase protein n=1 Tax=Lipomyces japonicus TaxID=56871 RepID=UPI0034CD25BA